MYQNGESKKKKKKIKWNGLYNPEKLIIQSICTPQTSGR